MAIKIGITGGIGSGKSMVSRLLEVLGVPVYISDLETKKLMVSDSFIREELSAFAWCGSVCRWYTAQAFVGVLSFWQSGACPKNQRYCASSCKGGFQAVDTCRTASSIVGIESAILVEAGFAGEVDAIVMVYAPEEVRISRAVWRDASSRELIESVSVARWMTKKSVNMQILSL